MGKTAVAAVVLSTAFAAGISPVHAAPAVLTATLSGANETGGGDADGGGTFRGEADADTGDFCFTLAPTRIAAPTAAHVHRGAAGADGPPVVTLEVTGKDSDACVAAEPDLLKEIVADPVGFYVNVHTKDFPKGAVRGQLAKQ